MIAVTTTGTATFVRRYLCAQDPRDVHTLAALRHPDFEIHWPQTAERVPSHDADVLIRPSHHK